MEPTYFPKHRDILHEYFIPKGHTSDFLKALRKAVIDFNINLLNISIREVRKDELSALPYRVHYSAEQLSKPIRCSLPGSQRRKKWIPPDYGAINFLERSLK